MARYANLDTLIIERLESRLIDCKDHVSRMIGEIDLYPNEEFQASRETAKHRQPSLDDFMGALGVNAYSLVVRLQELQKVIDKHRATVVQHHVNKEEEN